MNISEAGRRGGGTPDQHEGFFMRVMGVGPVVYVNSRLPMAERSQIVNKLIDRAEAKNASDGHIS